MTEAKNGGGDLQMCSSLLKILMMDPPKRWARDITSNINWSVLREIIFALIEKFVAGTSADAGTVLKLREPAFS